MQPDLPEYDPEAALVDARKSVDLGPNEDPSHWTLGLVLFLLGHFDEAAAEFATTLRLNPHPYIWEAGFHAVALSAIACKPDSQIYGWGLSRRAVANSPAASS